jgi:serine O-acetyltransferase
MEKLNNILALLNIIRFWPHLIIFMLSKNKKLIYEDLQAYKKEYSYKQSDIFVLLILLFKNRSFRTLFYHRIGNLKWLIKFLAPGMQNLSLTKTPIGGGLLLFHAYCTIIDAESIGKNCRIVSNVTIGYKNGKRVTIKDNVEILSNAVIVGGITIGNNCVIGPGAVVYKSIPDNCVVVGNPAYILKQDGKVVNKKL